jgi:hypothetical protein
MRTNKSLLIAAIFVFGGAAAFAQTPPEFTYQGSLKDGANPANGNYDFEIKLYSAPTGPALIGTRTRLNVPVTNGVFIVKLDFAGAAFNGEDRFLEVGVRLAGGGGYQQLLPRQQINHVPYSIRSVQANQADTATTATDALSLGGVAANQYVLTGDSRLSDARPPTGGSTFYIQNNPLLQQAANFNINGNGTVGGNLTVNGTLNANLPSGDGSYIQDRTGFLGPQNARFEITGNGYVGGTFHATGTINTVTQYNLGGSRILGIGSSDSLFVGWGAGTNSTGDYNTFVGRNAGGTMGAFGFANSFFGFSAGRLSDSAYYNSFFGYQAGEKTTGGDNAFFGSLTGDDNTTGQANAFFGHFAGGSNTVGNNNSFFGNQAGRSNVSGSANAFFGIRAGASNTASNNSFLGTNAGEFNTVGINNVFVGYQAGDANTTGDNNTTIGFEADVGSNNLTFATAIGSGAVVSASNTVQLGRTDGSDYVYIPGLLTLEILAVAGNENLCRNSFDRVGTCSSSLRYKTKIAPFSAGLNLVNRLRPISFTWKDGGMADLGLGAEDVEKIEPLLVTYNKSGQVEGVKYDRIGVVLLNAVKEQQAQIERQQQVIDGLKNLVCRKNRRAQVCK